MPTFRLVLMTLALALTVGIAEGQAASGCEVCDCNNARSKCQMQCQQTSSDYSKRVSCDASCTKTYSSCMDTAYKNQQSAIATTATTTTTTTTSTSSSGSSSTSASGS